MAGSPFKTTTMILLLQAQAILLFAAGGIMICWATSSTAKGGAGCGCPPDVCCSLLGYCGNTSDHCGAGCQSGPCLPPSPPAATNGVEVDGVVTQAFFQGIVGQAVSGCDGKEFYTRAAFLDAAATFPDFGRVGTADDSKREIAAFFAHATYLTGYFCNVADKDGPVCCDDQNLRYQCAPGKKYFARGPMQMAWNYNYGAASTAIGTDVLRSPETVASNATVSFQASLWFWMYNVHPNMASGGGGFGPSITAVHGGSACDASNAWLVDMLVEYYKDYCAQFGVGTGGNMSCARSLQTGGGEWGVFGDEYLKLNISVSVRTL